MNVPSFAVGNTPFRDIGRNRFVKCEEGGDNNYSCTHKDRRSARIIEDAVRAGIDTLVAITAGNVGLSLARMARATQIRVVAVMDNALTAAPDLLRQAGAEVMQTDLRRHLRAREIIDHAHPVGLTWNVTEGWTHAYAGIIDELAFEPDTIVCPLGTGQLASGLAEGIERRGWRTQLVMARPERIPSVADKISVRWSHYDGHVSHLCREGHRLVLLSEDDIRDGIARVPEGVLSEPSAAIVFAEALERHCIGETVLLNTGKGLC